MIRVEVILFIIILTALTFGYYVTDRLGKFIDDHFRGSEMLCKTDIRVYIDETNGKSISTVSEEVYAILDSLPEEDDPVILVCRRADFRIIKCLEETGCSIEFDLPQ